MGVLLPYFLLTTSKQIEWKFCCLDIFPGRSPDTNELYKLLLSSIRNYAILP